MMHGRIGPIDGPPGLASEAMGQKGPVLDRECMKAAPEPCIQDYYLVDGELRPWTGDREKVRSPNHLTDSTGGVYHPPVGEYPLLGKREAVEAVTAASRAYDRGLGEWPSLSVEQRISCVEKFLTLMKERREAIVERIQWEISKSSADAAKEFDRTIQYVQDSIAALRRLTKENTGVFSKDGVVATKTLTPRGVVLCMGPFNYPLNETFTTLMPALLMGNTVVMKPPKQGVLLLEPLLSAFKEAFPKGVVNVVYGDGREVVTPMMESGLVDSFSFIGSTKVAKILMGLNPYPHRLHTVLGLGAKNPGIVCADADLDKAAKECVTGALSYNGQRCTALKVIFVERKVADEFLSRVNAEVGKLKLGQPWEPDVKITPLAEPNKVEAMRALIEDAVAHGASVANDGGGRNEQNLFTPAVLYPVSPEMRIYHEEQFGPLVAIAPFDSISEPLSYVHQSPYGQQVSLFTQDKELIADLAPKLQRITNGRVNINTQCQRGPDELPFGGNRDSAYGVLSVRDALLAYSIPAVIAAKDGEFGRGWWYSRQGQDQDKIKDKVERTGK